MPDQSLSRERILAAALRLVQREGMEALSMRRLAQELDVWPMSIYTYFRDKDELLDAVAAGSVGDLSLPPGERGAWREELRELLLEARRAIGQDPGGMGAHLARAFLTPEVLRLSESAMALLQEGGLAPGEAARAWRALWSYTFGFATFRLGDTPAEARRRARTAIAALDDDAYPTLLAATGELAAALSGDDEFDHGLGLLLDGIASRAAVP